jgi:DNA modification methylase
MSTEHQQYSPENQLEVIRQTPPRTVWKSFRRTRITAISLHFTPQVKPVSPVADALLDCTAPGGLVLDSFLGSGSTLMAAERVGRICHGIRGDLC